MRVAWAIWYPKCSGSPLKGITWLLHNMQMTCRRYELYAGLKPNEIFASLARILTSHDEAVHVR